MPFHLLDVQAQRRRKLSDSTSDRISSNDPMKF
jgi:hypothetical protein